MQLLATTQNQSTSTSRLPETHVADAPALARLDLLRASLRRTRAASAMLGDMRIVSELQGVPALDALCIRLSVLLGRPLGAYAPNTPRAHFDEAWLLSVFDAAARDDADSYAFLLRTRLSQAEASEVHFLVCRAQSAFADVK